MRFSQCTGPSQSPVKSRLWLGWLYKPTWHKTVNLCVQQRSIYWGLEAGFFMAACDLGIIKATVADTLKS